MLAVEQKLVNQVFLDIALLLGGVVALHRHEISDELVWVLANDLKRLHSQYTQKSKQRNQRIEVKPHPAITELLRKIQRTSGHAQ